MDDYGITDLIIISVDVFDSHYLNKRAWNKYDSMPATIYVDSQNSLSSSTSHYDPQTIYFPSCDIPATDHNIMKVKFGCE